MSEALPKGWALCELADISSIITGKTPSRSKPEYFDGPIPFIKPGDVKNQGKIKFTDQSLSEQGAKMVPCIPANSIAVTCIGNLGRVAITDVKSATNQQINSVIPSPYCSTKYIYYYLMTLKNWMESEASATTVTIINKSRFSKAPVLIPPLIEQIRIANKLDSLLAKVDVAQTRLEKIPTLLKRFRQSILAAATSGTLTKEWRETGGIPEGLETLLGTVGKVIAGQSPSVAEVNTEGRGKPYVTGPEQWDGKKILHHKWTEFPKRIAPEGSIFVTVKGAGVGKTFPGCYAAIGRDVYAFIPNEGVDYKYVLFAIQSSAEEVIAKAKGLIPGLTKADITQHSIYLPSEKEQKEIVRRVESLFSLADSVEKQYVEAKKRTDRLTQSLLAKAFRGELVPQDPNDEPASELLKRIQAEREQQVERKSKRITAKGKAMATATATGTIHVTAGQKNQKKATMKLNDASENYLADLLTQIGGEAGARDLWKKTDLTIDDFYAKLKQEMLTGRIVDDKASSDPDQRKLKLA